MDDRYNPKSLPLAKKQTYDSKCYDLALIFLGDFPLDDSAQHGLAHRLAVDIQRTIEDFIAEKGLK